MSRYPQYNFASSNSVHGKPVSIDKILKRQFQCRIASIVKESTIPGQQKCLQVSVKKHARPTVFWLAVATARAGAVAAVFNVLQKLSSTDKSRVTLAEPAQLSPSHTPSPSRAPLLLSRVPPRMGGSSTTAEPCPSTPKKLTETPGGYVWVHIYK